MGYEIHFTPSAEKMETYKPWGYDKASYEPEEKRVEATRLELLTYCLKNHKDDGVYRIKQQIEFTLRLLSSQIEQNEKEFAYKRWSEDEEHDLWYCGWEFSHDSNCEPDSIMRQTVEDLVILADVVETPDYFKDRDGFNEKYNVITDRIAGFIELMETYYTHKIIDDLDEFKKAYDDEESDGQIMAPNLSEENNEEETEEEHGQFD